MLVEMLTGKHPFPGQTDHQVWQSVVNAQLNPLPSTLSLDVKKLVTLMLSKAPDRRPTIEQIIKTKIVKRYIRNIIGYGREIKKQMDKYQVQEDATVALKTEEGPPRLADNYKGKTNV